ncbi:hypothetical protein Hypma_009236 [Hypsizygus marmoreus]|uniref:Uncharacterized protein n=1 Tax=Hypsizygus marmoreus TaxID=39966 RepID=A0A369JQL1_HYPMA|nr:hypothetical protein Hypma_009236 [Hypsizygus marmoreus]
MNDMHSIRPLLLSFAFVLVHSLSSGRLSSLFTLFGIAMFSFISLVFICALASRVLAFSITVGSRNLTTTQILNVTDSVVTTACATNCTTASTQIQACNDDATCLCRADTVAALLTCEQCMFNKLVEVNKPMDFRVGSQPVLSAYAASCKAAVNVTLAANQTSLTLPSTWDSLYVAVLPPAGAAVTVIAGAFLGISSLFLLSNL